MARIIYLSGVTEAEDRYGRTLFERKKQKNNQDDFSYLMFYPDSPESIASVKAALFEADVNTTIYIDVHSDGRKIDFPSVVKKDALVYRANKFADFLSSYLDPEKIVPQGEKRLTINFVSCSTGGSPKDIDDIAPNYSFALRFMLRLKELKIDAYVIARNGDVVIMPNGSKAVVHEFFSSKNKKIKDNSCKLLFFSPVPETFLICKRDYEKEYQRNTLQGYIISPDSFYYVSPKKEKRSAAEAKPTQTAKAPRST